MPPFRFGNWRLEAWLTSADGGTTATGTVGKFRDVRAVAAIGIGILLFPQATMFGNGTSWSNFTFGGVMIVCRWLSASGGTDRIGCFAGAGSPLRACADRLPVSKGGKYSDAG